MDSSSRISGTLAACVAHTVAECNAGVGTRGAARECTGRDSKGTGAGGAAGVSLLAQATASPFAAEVSRGICETSQNHADSKRT